MEPVSASAAQTASFIDLVLGVGLLLSVVLGAWRGLITELLALLGWGVAYFAAQWFGPSTGAHLPIGDPGTRLNLLAGMLVAFVLSWLGWTLLAWLLKQVIQASGLGGTDRLMGGVFGLMRGLTVVLVLVTLVSMTPLRDWGAWQSSRGVAWTLGVLQGLRPILPDPVVQFLPKQA
jgi:membrane protein required for colicin V production